MTDRLQSIVNTIGTLASHKIDREMPDTDFVATVEAANLLCNLYDEAGIDRSAIRGEMETMYPEFSRRILAKKNIQQAMPLVKALNKYIYGRKADHADRGPIDRRKALAKYCADAVEAYRTTPWMHTSDYLFALLTAARITDIGYDKAVCEYKAQMDEFIKDLDAVPVEERIRRVWAFSKLRSHIPVDNYELWVSHKEALKHVEPSQLDDTVFILWCEATGIWPEDEMARRSGKSRRLQVEHLRRLAGAAVKDESRSAERKKLEKELNSINDEFIGDFIGMEIDADMPLSTLTALADIFFMRLQLTQVAGADNESTYESLWRLRFEEIADALTQKYPKTTDLNERIAILDSLETISQLVNYEHNEMALEEAQKLSDRPDLNDHQRFSLGNIIRQDYRTSMDTINMLLPQTRNAFDMKALLSIEEMGTEDQRQAIRNKYTELFRKALAEENSAELADLLAAAPYCNTNPEWRPLLTDLAAQAAGVEGLSLPEKRVNPIAAEIYSEIDKLIGKHEVADQIPA